MASRKQNDPTSFFLDNSHSPEFGLGRKHFRIAAGESWESPPPPTGGRAILRSLTKLLPVFLFFSFLGQSVLLFSLIRRVTVLGPIVICRQTFPLQYRQLGCQPEHAYKGDPEFVLSVIRVKGARKATGRLRGAGLIRDQLTLVIRAARISTWVSPETTRLTFFRELPSGAIFYGNTTVGSLTFVPNSYIVADPSMFTSTTTIPGPISTKGAATALYSVTVNPADVPGAAEPFWLRGVHLLLYA